MKNLFYWLTLIAIIVFSFSSCNEDDPDLYPSELVKGAYLINYGGAYGSGGASISRYDYDKNVITNSYFQTQNEGFELLSNIQYAYEYKDSIYLIGNANDQIIVTNPLFVQTKNGITEQIFNPRFCVAEGNYLYVSCWGSDPDYVKMPGSYIAKLNVNTNVVESIIDLPGGPEGLAIANGKLYAALNYMDSVASISLSDNNAINYIATPTISSYFVKDENENLYVTLVSYFDYSNTGLGFINTSTDVLEENFKMEGVSTNYASVVNFNNDYSKIYLLTSQYDEYWNLSGAIKIFDVAAGTYSDFITGISGPSGISINPNDDKIYLFTYENLTESGEMKIYNEDGTLEHELATGISPLMAIYLE